MNDEQRRLCNVCGYEVKYETIEDAHDPNIVTQFVALLPSGVYKGIPAVIDYCPRCKSPLSLSSTTEPTRQQLEFFYCEAMSRGWVAEGAITAGDMPGSKRYTYQKGSWRLIDTWYQNPFSESSVGDVKIYFGMTLLWTSNYYGWYKEDAIPTLIKALKSAFEQNLFVGGRGPKEYCQGDLIYTNKVEEMFDRQTVGQEQILQGTRRLGTHWYSCYWLW